MTPPRRPLQLPSPEQWAASFGMSMATKVFKALLEEREKLGEENYRLAFSMFLSGLMSAFVNLSLLQKPKDEILYTQEEILKFTETNFQNIKSMLQTSVANGFQSGIMAWSGQEIEYYCLIKPTPAAINDKPC